MAFNITHRYGDMETDVPMSKFEELFDEIENGLDDVEHCSVSVTHESEWNLGYYGNGYLIFENLEDGGESHMREVPKEKVIQLWEALAKGEIDQIQNESWLPGYG